MNQRNWNKARPNSLTNAMSLCVEYARAKHNRSVERIADLMGTQPHTLYKWLGTGRMPANMIRPFEHACGCHFVTWWYAYGAHKLLIDIPQGKRATEMDLATLQGAIAEATTTLIQFYAGSANADEAMTQITAVMASLAWHRENVSRSASPELSLFDDHHD